MKYIGLEDGIDVTSPNFWTEASEAELRNIFRPSDRSNEELPLQDTRIKLLREAGSILNSVRNPLLPISAESQSFPLGRNVSIHKPSP